jgi:hypothetical protein
MTDEGELFYAILFVIDDLIQNGAGKNGISG